MERTILHCDLNNFYASVEQLSHPEYDGMPIAVCGDPERRHGIVLAKNYLAKAAGVQTGEAIWLSKQKCPNIVFLEPHFEEYVKYSKIVHDLYTEYTDKVESFGLDECWLDVTGSVKLFGNGEEIANKIREEVKRRTGLTISVGVSFTKVLAKLGSDLKKPDATVVLNRSNYMDIIGYLPPSELLMIGRKTAKKLATLNIKNIRELSNASREMLRDHFGVIGDSMINSACGIETEAVGNYYDTRVPKSVSNGTTTSRNMTSLDDAKIVIYALCELISVRMRKFGLIAEGIAVDIRDTDLEYSTKQMPLPFATSNAADLAENALILFEKLHTFPKPLRAITVAAIRLSDRSKVQLSIFGQESEKEEKLENTIDSIRGKYGYNSVKRGLLLKNDIAGNLHEEDGFEPFKR